ncbi:MAG: transcription elongation factor GreA [Patescibacteria group bacterium]|nr:transcription elongation factor GreA [Patescibacteria group bacterium]MDD4611004.1 transcription elongation factor GreA [Patescibacteria group bacterium]
MPDQIITKEGYEKLKNELEYLLNVKRKEIAERIETAKELGDLSENAEYHDAKDAQAFNDGRIGELTAILKNVTIVESEHSKNEVSMGSKITVENGNGKKEFTIVSFNEVDPAQGKISNESPLGLAFLGKKKGDKVKVNTPRGEVEYKIVKIE